MYDALLILSKKDCKRALHQNVQFFSDLITAVRDLLWYISLHNVKSASSNGATLPTFFKPLIGFITKRGIKTIMETLALKIIVNLLELSTICWENPLL